MSGDSLTYDMAMMSESSPEIFVKRDWLTLQDQMNGSYQGNQLTIDTSQLANSNKYMDYRNSYLNVPMIMAATAPTSAAGVGIFQTANTGIDAGVEQIFSLKNWFGNVVHSMILDYAGTTIIQQTSLCGLHSVFVLMTTLSMADVETMGPHIGFYPDDSNFSFESAASKDGVGLCNNRKQSAQGNMNALLGSSEFENKGIWARWSRLLLNASAIPGATSTGESYNDLQNSSRMDTAYRSRLLAKKHSSNADGSGICYQIQAYIYLRHLHSFFSQVPLLKGVFFRLTLNLNQPVVEVESTSGALNITNIISPLGGVSPIMISSIGSKATSLAAPGGSAAVTFLSAGTAYTGDIWVANASGGGTTEGPITATISPGSGTVTSQGPSLNQTVTGTMRVTLNVGSKIIDSQQKTAWPGDAPTGTIGDSCFLNVPAYTFNPSFEQAYLSKPTKTIVYTDLYQFTTAVTPAHGTFQYLISNGISNIKSVLIVPFTPQITPDVGSTPGLKYLPFQSPFDTAGGGTTMATPSLSNFNVVIAGQNMIYNQVQRSYEEFINQLYGCNSVNAGLTDGLTSSLIDFWKFQQLYGYYYVNCSRMLAVDQAVPKSVQISGINNTEQNMQFYVFVEYGVQVNVDVLTGARV
jgi:hypothetical protein